MIHYQICRDELRVRPRRWLVTGVAGFIGSNLLETLLNLGQTVVGLDNFSTGYRRNLQEVEELVGPAAWRRFTLVEGDIRDLATCRQVCRGVDCLLHQAALASVPRSVADPLLTNENNIVGFLNIMVAARDEGVRRIVYAASSATYGDHPALPKVEEVIGRPLSPYAVTKYVNELYAEVFALTYGCQSIGLRYFNIFGRRQDPDGAYAAVIPKWFAGLLGGEEIVIYGSGETSRDFCYIDNCVQANILAACAAGPGVVNQVYNVACGQRTSLNELYGMIKERVQALAPAVVVGPPVHLDFREGDILHSLADIEKGRRLLGYSPHHSVRSGLDAAADWYARQARAS